MTLANRVLSGWGNTSPANCQVARPEKEAALQQLILASAPSTWICRGLGRSYGDPAVNPEGGTLSLQRLNRMLSWDPATGVLECEGGVVLGDIVDTFLPRGWFLPVTPGTQFVTIGGAIANDVHGKNHHRDGSFGNWVQSLRLMIASGEIIECSPHQHPELFWATVGGVGLTGIILSATIKLQAVSSPFVQVDTTRTDNIKQTMDLMLSTDDNYQYSVAWIDCLAKGDSLGRCVLMQGSHAEGTPEDFQAASGRKLNVPFNFPSWVLNSYTTRAFNALYYRMHPSSKADRVHYQPYFYPLDAVTNWNRIYGKRGFFQYQVSFPLDRSEHMIALLERIQESGQGSFLAVLKLFGNANEGLLSYPSRGFTLALDFAASAETQALFKEWDQWVLEAGGRLYLAKDATTSPEAIQQMYPRLDEFRLIKKQVDPTGIFQSAMSHRLRLL